MGFRGSPVRIRPSRLRLRSKLLWGPFVLAETLSGRSDSAGSRSGNASGDEVARQNRRFEPSVTVLSLDPDVLRETSGGRRRRPELNPAVPIRGKVYSLRALDALGEFPCLGGSTT